VDWKQEFLKRFDALAETLHTTGEHLWGVLVRQGVAEGVGSLVLALLCLVVLVVCYKTIRWAYKTAPTDESTSVYDTAWKARYLTPAIISAVGGVLSGIGLFVNLYQGVMWAVNPEYFALEKVLSLFQK
jgi:hypothetical protein